ncbi:MAG: hypothetical protein KJZ78_08795 [Bryobacteraceae bacterium]|nr:hypothetical protein [Bryobacteraceae bacterium]
MMTSSARAESVQYTGTFPQLIHFANGTADGARCLPYVNEGYATVSYNAVAVDASTGESVCNATVPKGARVRFKFVPSVPQDIYWFTTGFYWDSPYGDWVTGAASPGAANICADKNYIYGGSLTANAQSNWYGTLSVNPPVKSISGLGAVFSSCTKPDADGTIVCTASSEGSATPIFNFGSTYGRFYIRDPFTGQCTPDEPRLMGVSSDVLWPRDGTGWRYCYGGNQRPYDFQVPARSISCPITVIDADGDAPWKPTVVATGSPLQCVVGSPHALTISATDPDGDSVRYGIDWDANGTVDQFLPATGYVSSGASQGASRTYAISGTKSVKVIAIDDRGLTSGWAGLSFSCTESESQGEEVGNGEGDGTGGNSLQGRGDTTPNLTIRAAPSLIRAGEVTHVHWSASNVTGCTVQGTNGDGVDAGANKNSRWQGAISPEPEGVESSPIVARTTYTLSCEQDGGGALTQRATVNIVPFWNEQ